MRALELAETFHRTGEWDYSCGTALLRFLAIRPGMRVLELGSATGRLAIDAAHLVAPDGEVVAIEPSPGRAEFARRIYRAGNISFLRGGVGEVEELDEAAFDLVYSNLLVHRLEEPARALAAVHRGLKPGGVFAFTCPLAPPALVGTLEMVVFSHEDFSAFREGSSGVASWSCQPVEYWTGLVKEAGFAGVSFTPIVAELAPGSARALATWWEAATDGRFLQGLTPQERERALSHIEGQFSALWGERPLRMPVEVMAFQTRRPL